MKRFYIFAAILCSATALSAEFGGYPCMTDDCSDHQAGYDWAEENNIDDPKDCNGNSQLFIDGCRSYAEEDGQIDRGDEDNEDDREYFDD
ncbi:MAG: hypothetical protein FWD67_09530 [Betaproteobacteria bacterium]|nr:hypothetical protein [Betaproteobacteria bacterium]